MHPINGARVHAMRPYAISVPKQARAMRLQARIAVCDSRTVSNKYKE